MHDRVECTYVINSISLNTNLCRNKTSIINRNQKAKTSFTYLNAHFTPTRNVVITGDTK